MVCAVKEKYQIFSDYFHLACRGLVTVQEALPRYSWVVPCADTRLTVKIIYLTLRGRSLL